MGKKNQRSTLENSAEFSTLIEEKRALSLNMPQMIFEGLSEQWFLKELGDMHWAMITRGLNAKSDQLTDSAGNRLYASFVRICWQGNSELSTFKENEEFDMQSRLSRFGEKLFFSDAEVHCSTKKIKSSLMSVFAARKTDNNNLSKASPLHVKKSKIAIHDQIPEFGREYLRVKAKLFSNETTQDKERIKIQQHEFDISDGVQFTCDYALDPYEDMNGVNLLYFASYPKISDKCERLYFHELRDKMDIEGDWAMASSSIARDIFYFGNANPDESIIYELNSCEYIAKHQVKLVSSLYRKKDKELIARVFTIKTLTEAEKDESKSTKNFTTLWKQKENKKPGKAAGSKKKPNATPDIEDLRTKLSELLKPMLGINDITTSTNLKPFGLESVVFTELSEQLNKAYSIKSNPSRLYEFSTIDEIARYLIETFEKKIENPDENIERPTSIEIAGKKKLQKQSEESQTAKISVKSADKANQHKKEPPSPIAIVGLSGRFPQADNLDEFWNNLITGKDCISEIPGNRWRWEDYYENPLKNRNKTNSKWGGFLKNIRAFDTGFFNITPREAELMDPQQRLLLEETWHLFEHAGHDPLKLAGTPTGVFIGVCHDDYNNLLISEQVDAELYDTTGSSFSVLPNRISYFFDLHGPSVAIDTACSSSLIGVHQAVQAIHQGECNVAIAGASIYAVHKGATCLIATQACYHQTGGARHSIKALMAT